MECRYTFFDRVIFLTKKLPKRKIKEAVKIIQEFSFEDFLDFCVENNCFTEEQKSIIIDFIIMWEDLTGNYYEEDEEKLIRLYEAVGISRELFNKYLE